jgi:hypothetical protein
MVVWSGCGRCRPPIGLTERCQPPRYGFEQAVRSDLDRMLYTLDIAKGDSACPKRHLSGGAANEPSLV